jgi:hypothetical protein
MQRSAIHSLARLCREKGVPLVFFELPLPEVTRRACPDKVYEEYMQFMRELANRYGAEFFTIEQLGLPTDEEYFLDYEHTNLKGALSVTRKITRQVLLPHLREGPLASSPRK